jgi:hypothetical protein
MTYKDKPVFCHASCCSGETNISKLEESDRKQHEAQLELDKLGLSYCGWDSVTELTRRIKNKMSKNYVKLWKEGDHMGIETNASDIKDFQYLMAEALSTLIENKRFEGDWMFQLELWIPNMLEIAYALKGYKSDVEKDTIIRAGDVLYSEKDVVINTSEKELEKITNGAGSQ